MKFWIDAQLTPQLAQWLMITFSVQATSLRELGLRDAQDREICEMAQTEGTVIITKDSDFIELVTVLEPHHKYFAALVAM
ncbi:MAG: DUF5615 family PIN-like protein [Crocosphaera sp.]